MQHPTRRSNTHSTRYNRHPASILTSHRQRLLFNHHCALPNYRACRPSTALVPPAAADPHHDTHINPTHSIGSPTNAPTIHQSEHTRHSTNGIKSRTKITENHCCGQRHAEFNDTTRFADRSNGLLQSSPQQHDTATLYGCISYGRHQIVNISATPNSIYNTDIEKQNIFA